jgi:hypothetical protein
MRRSVRQAPSAASTRPPRRTAARPAFSLTFALTQSRALDRGSPTATSDQSGVSGPKRVQADTFVDLASRPQGATSC